MITRPIHIAVILTLALAVSGAAGVAPSVAVAAPSRREQAREEFEKAQVHYRLGRFQEALEGYSRAYELFRAPALLFNIGQCHKHLKNYERAIFFFEGYLHDETSTSKRRLAEELIAESKAALEQQRTGARPPEETATKESPGGPTPPAKAAAQAVPALEAPRPATPEPAPALVATPAPEQPAATPVTRRWWFWTAIGVGALAVAAGAFAYYESGGTTVVPPGGSLGTLDRR